MTTRPNTNKHSRLAQIRVEKGLTVNQLSALSNVSRGAIHYIENGSTPKDVTLEKIATALGCSVDYLKGEPCPCCGGSGLKDDAEEDIAATQETKGFWTWLWKGE